MDFKALLVATGFLITAFPSLGTPSPKFIAQNEAGLVDADINVSFLSEESSSPPSLPPPASQNSCSLEKRNDTITPSVDEQCCFEGYAESKVLDLYVIRTCICSFNTMDASDCSIQLHHHIDQLRREISQKISSKAANIYYNDCFCRQNEGKLLVDSKTKDACYYLRKLALTHGKYYSYNCEQRLPNHTQCSQFSGIVLGKIPEERHNKLPYCNIDYKYKDYCNDLITGFLTSPKCLPGSTLESCTQHVESSMSKDSCSFGDAFDVPSCTEGHAQSSCDGGIKLETASKAIDPIEGNAEEDDSGEDQVPTSPLEDLAVELASEDQIIPPFPVVGGNAGGNAGGGVKRGGNLSSNSGKNTSQYVPSIGKYPSVYKSNIRSNSQARTSRVGVTPIPISPGGGPVVSNPMDLPLMGRQPPVGGPPGGGNQPGEGAPTNPGGNPFGPMGGLGPTGNPGGGPSGIGGLGPGGASPRRGRRRTRGGAKSPGSPHYMSSSGGRGLQGGSPSSAINRRVRQKMAANQKKNKNKKGVVNNNTQGINAAFQRGLRRVRGHSTRPATTDFLPLFYFPDVENAYEELRDQNQFLDGKGI